MEEASSKSYGKFNIIFFESGPISPNLIYGADFDWLAWFYDTDIWIYSILNEKNTKLNLDIRPHNFWYSWN